MREIIIEDEKGDWLAFGFKEDGGQLRYATDIIYFDMLLFKSILRNIVKGNTHNYWETYYDLKIYPQEGLIVFAHTYVGSVRVHAYLFNPEKLSYKVKQLLEMLE